MTLVPGLHRHAGMWAQAVGILRPSLYFDPGVDARPGFEALMFHEALHVTERHALVGALILVLGALGFALALHFGAWTGLPLSLLGAAALWLLWRREQEVRADAYALWGVSMDGDGKVTERTAEIGLREFRAFTLLHEHPEGAFWRWCYGESPRHRIERARALARRERWLVC